MARPSQSSGVRQTNLAFHSLYADPVRAKNCVLRFYHGNVEFFLRFYLHPCFAGNLSPRRNDVKRLPLHPADLVLSTMGDRRVYAVDNLHEHCSRIGQIHGRFAKWMLVSE